MNEGEIVGNYRLVERIGKGGFGVVFRAEEIAGGMATAAVKFFQLDGNEAERAEARGQLEQEMKILARLDHPNVLRYRTSVTYQPSGASAAEATIALVTDFADGGDVFQMLRAFPQGLPEPQLHSVILAIAEALAYLQSQDPPIVHRDVKPDNFLLVNGRVCLSDVALAKSLSGTRSVHEGTHTVLYTAPEMFDDQVHLRSDVYALGVSAFELLTGRPPFEGTVAAIIRSHISKEPVFPPTMPAFWRELIAGMLKKDPAERPDINEVVARLKGHATRQVQAGDVIGGNYRLIEQVGTGSSAVVYRAEPLRGAKSAVAVKIFFLEPNEDDIARLEDLEHPNILKYRATLEHEGRLCLVTEFSDGGDVGSLLTGFPEGLPNEQVMIIAKGAIEGLCYLHEQNIVHRDIKPTNILIVKNRICLGDVDIAMAPSTGTGDYAAALSIYYTAPEMFGGCVRLNSDVYSLGITLFHLLTGRVPFDGGPSEAMKAHLSDEVKYPRHLPSYWCELLEKMLIKDPTHRPESTQVRQWLQEIQTVQSVRVLSSDQIVPELQTEPTITALFLVDSTAKAETLRHILGDGYCVMVIPRDTWQFPPDSLGLKIDGKFEPELILNAENEALFEEVKIVANQAQSVFLATELDGAGEVHAHNIATFLDTSRPMIRIKLRELTKSSIEQAITGNPELDFELIESQLALTALNRLVAYFVSPKLSQKFPRALSIDLVQAAVLAAICRREDEIQSFQPEFRTVAKAKLNSTEAGEVFFANLVRWRNEEPNVDDEECFEEIQGKLKRAQFIVSSIVTEPRRIKPPAPFITSTLIQDATHRLGLSANQVMTIAMELYEGIKLLDSGPTSLITYPLTDSTAISYLALQDVKDCISDEWGEEYLPAIAHQFDTYCVTTAIEAIRPVNVFLALEDISGSLNSDQFRLYELIRERFLASQMRDAEVESISIDVVATGLRKKASTLTALDKVVAGDVISEPIRSAEGRVLLKSGSTLTAKSISVLRRLGFQHIYTYQPEPEVSDTRAEFHWEGTSVFVRGFRDAYQVVPTTGEAEIDELSCLVDLQIGDVLELLEFFDDEEPINLSPPPFMEAPLVRESDFWCLEHSSVIPAIIQKLKDSGYIEATPRGLRTTVKGYLVHEHLCLYFAEILNERFINALIATMGSKQGTREAVLPLVRQLYQVVTSPNNTADSPAQETPSSNKKSLGLPCTVCGSEYIIKDGPYGEFLCCSNVGRCTSAKPWNGEAIAKCPICNDGSVVERKSRSGRTYFKCDRWESPVDPCIFSSWVHPADAKCPKCSGNMTRITKVRRNFLRCSNQDCKHIMNMPKRLAEIDDASIQAPALRARTSEAIAQLASARRFQELLVQANEGSSAAQFELGWRFNIGVDTKTDHGLGFLWMRTAAEAGHGYACRNLGHMYKLGQGTPVDAVKAAFWYHRAATLGIAEAQKELEKLTSRPSGIASGYRSLLSAIDGL